MDRRPSGSYLHVRQGTTDYPPKVAYQRAIASRESRTGKRGPVRCCYKAGPCGLALQRFLTARCVCCDVIAPALIPRRTGGSHQDRPAGCASPRRPVSGRRPHGDSHSERARRSNPRFAAVSGGRPGGSAPRAASAPRHGNQVLHPQRFEVQRGAEAPYVLRGGVVEEIVAGHEALSQEVRRPSDGWRWEEAAALETRRF